MKDRTIAILESRLSELVADLVRTRGGTPFLAPALDEVPDVDPALITSLLRDLRERPPAWCIFQTGVGTRALFATTDALGLTPQLLQLLDASRVAVRGPKPTAALRARGVRIDAAAGEPFTTHEVLAELRDVPLDGARVVVQRYGESNVELRDALAARGAEVIEIATYRWGLPRDVAPRERLIDARGRDEIALVAFTSATQAQNLFEVARRAGSETTLRHGIARARVASIGPVCSAALRELGGRVDIEARPPKLGPFIEAIDGAWAGAAR
jgi:uroporphyrinogen-III synthase